MDLLKKYNYESSKIPTKDLEKILPILSQAYYNDEELVSDEIYDELYDELKERDPKNKVLKNIGAGIKGDKVKLPVWLGSMDKVKPDSRALELYIQKYPGPYVLSDKLDGFSALISYSPEGIKIYTRGDGYYGQDISYLKKYLPIPDNKKDTFCVRGELIISKERFFKEFQYLKKPRTAVGSVINSKKPDPKVLKAIDFVAFEFLIKGRSFKASEQFFLLKNLGFKVSKNKQVKEIDSNILLTYLKERREKGKYEIDGIIVSQDKAYEINQKDNPKHSVAFKSNPKGIKTVIEEIIWQSTKHSILFPRIKIRSVIIDGDTINFVSGKNAKFIEDNKLGPGSEIEVVKSGGVIPDVSRVVKGTGASFPPLKYVWDETHVNIVLREEDENVKINKLLHFFVSLSIELVKKGTVVKFYDGGLKTIKSICLASIEDFLKLEGIKERSADNIYQAIHSVIDNPLPLSKLMLASLCFPKGLGSKRFDLILEAYPKVYKLEKISKEEILVLDGFSEITAEQFLEGYPKFIKFLKEHSFLKFKQREAQKTATEYVVFTGFRNKELKAKLEAKGMVVQDNITSKTTLVYTNDANSTNKKFLKAKEKGIKIKIYQN